MFSFSHLIYSLSTISFSALKYVMSNDSNSLTICNLVRLMMNDVMNILVCLYTDIQG